jgi:hypothetical protein
MKWLGDVRVFRGGVDGLRSFMSGINGQGRLFGGGIYLRGIALGVVREGFGGFGLGGLVFELLLLETCLGRDNIFPERDDKIENGCEEERGSEGEIDEGAETLQKEHDNKPFAFGETLD